MAEVTLWRIVLFLMCSMSILKAEEQVAVAVTAFSIAGIDAAGKEEWNSIQTKQRHDGEVGKTVVKGKTNSWEVQRFSIVEFATLTYLSSEFFETLAELPKLWSLSLYNNGLVAVPESVSRISSLGQLMLNGNDLAALPESIGDLTNLSHLNLNGNNLIEVPQTVSKLIKLDVFSFTGNELTYAPDLSTVTRLRRFEMHNNPDLYCASKMAPEFELAAKRQNWSSGYWVADQQAIDGGECVEAPLNESGMLTGWRLAGLGWCTTPERIAGLGGLSHISEAFLSSTAEPVDSHAACRASCELSESCYAYSFDLGGSGCRVYTDLTEYEGPLEHIVGSWSASGPEGEGLDVPLGDITTYCFVYHEFEPVHLPEACVGSWSTCDATCNKVYTVESEAADGGALCPHDDGVTKTCTDGDCPIDACPGRWETCTSDCIKRWTITEEDNDCSMQFNGHCSDGCKHMRSTTYTGDVASTPGGMSGFKIYGAGCKMIAYDQPNFAGRSITFKETMCNLCRTDNPPWNGKLKSIKLVKEGGADCPTNGAEATCLPGEGDCSAPTEAPTVLPTQAPSISPTQIPTAIPTQAPSGSPTQIPTAIPTACPTASPTQVPTVGPTESPTASPTQIPTTFPTQAPSISPTQAPSGSPTQIPTASPTQVPTVGPTESPTASPTLIPTTFPTQAPSGSPTQAPTVSTVAQQWVVRGKPGSSCAGGGDCSTRLVPMDEGHALRCCADSPLTSRFQNSGGSCSVYHNTFFGRKKGSGSQNSDCTVGTINFADGWKFCLSMGARMCTKAEVQAGCVRGSGCGADTQTIWAVSSAEDATVTDFCNFFNSNMQGCTARTGCSFDAASWICSSSAPAPVDPTPTPVDPTPAPIDPPPAPVVDADCQGSWSTCNGNCEKMFFVSSPKTGNGSNCEASPGDVELCSPGEDDCPPQNDGCTGDVPGWTDENGATCSVWAGYDCDAAGIWGYDAGYIERLKGNCCATCGTADCVGHWEPCTADCTSSFTVTQPKSGSGTPCPAFDGEQQTCSPGVDSCPHDNDCVGDWSTCDQNCLRHFFVSSPKTGNGSDCVASPGDVQPCDHGQDLCRWCTGADNPGFGDIYGYTCADWAGHDCWLVLTHYGYTEADAKDIQNNCCDTCLSFYGWNP